MDSMNVVDAILYQIGAPRQVQPGLILAGLFAHAKL
jgi:hypothetical protein